MQLEQQKIQM